LKRCTIYLADLAYNFLSNGPFTFPLNIGYIASYVKKYYPEIEIRLFKFPMDLIKAIEKKRPNIIGLSNYTWNLELNKGVTKYIKNIDKNIITVLGGPDFPLKENQQKKYLKERPFVDFYVINQGEIGFLNIVKRFIEGSGMKDTPIDNCTFLSRNLVIGETKAMVNLDEIPSPYLGGLLDEFFESYLIPVIETSRGCPYSCSYCSWGNAYKNVLLKFSVERVKSEMDYIFERVKNTGFFHIADANFGILDRDLEIVNLLKENIDKNNYPTSLIVAWAKNCPKRIIEMAEILGDRAQGTTSFQSFNQKALNNIGRKNIPIDQFKQIQEYFNSHHIKSVSELILGMPGETKQSHEAAIKELFDYNVSEIICYNLRLLGGAKLNDPDQRKKFNISTKFRLVDGAFGKFGDITTLESEEMVLSTYTMNQEDILYFRPIHWLIQFLWNKKYYEELLHFLKNNTINPLDLIKNVLELRNAPSAVKIILEDFYKDSKEEWFDSHQELKEYYLKNFDHIAKGSFGKLNYKYTYRILLEAREAFDSYLYLLSKSLLKTDSLALRNIMKFLSASFIDFNGGFKEKIVGFDYDILQWKMDSYRRPIEEYEKKVKYRFYLDKKLEDSLNKSLKQFKSKNLNLTLRKMTEYLNTNDLFYRIEKVNVL